MSATIHTILDQIRDAASSESDKGARFEALIRQYLLHDPVYQTQFSKVWRWMDYPGREGKADTGIDLVAERIDGTGFVAIQCKCYDADTTIQKSHIDSFLAASSKKNQYVGRIIVSSTPHWSKHAEDAIHNLHPPVHRIDLNELNNSAIDWSQFDVNKPKVVLKPKKTLRPHQKTALDQVRTGLETQDRGQLIMACGTGKTFTSLKIAEEHAGKNGLVLFLVPSLSLLSQTLREWLTESAIPLHCYAVCSDTKIGKHDDSDPTSLDDLEIPATTNGKELSKSFAHLAGTPGHKDKMTVVFSTYQSIQAIHDAQKHGVPEFDIIICDEAHRTTGAKLEGDEESSFVKVHDAKYLKAKKRLYMTATPRLYSADAKTKAKEREVPLWSMDNEEHYGKVLYYLGFSSAVSQGLLSDYKVVILGVDEQIAPIIQATIAPGKQKKELPLVDPAKIIGCWNALAGKYDDGRKPILHRAVAFTTSIKQSETFKSQFTQIVADYRNGIGDTDKKALQCEVKHVDGAMNALERNDKLQWLKEETKKNECRILSNARCLSEGVDVPALDAVMFLTPRKSKVDVVQSVGRVMRKAEGKDYGYIILPVVIKAGTKPEDALNDNEAYEMVWGVLQALRAHDDRFQNQVNVFELDGKEPEKIEVHFIGSSTSPSVPKEVTGKPDAQQLLGFTFEDIKLWKNALYATLVKKCGEKRYWEDWAKDVAELAQQHVETLLKLADDETHKYDFMAFLDHLRSNLNDSVTEQEAVEMLAQHIITKPVLTALFDSEDFSNNNPVAQALDKVVALLEDATEYSEKNTRLEKFYESVKSRVASVKTAEGKQKIVIELYDKFFKTAFPKMSEKLGIVYTPIEVVDFIIKSVDQALQQEFGVGIGTKDVHILDPFTGTGTFIVRLLQSGLIAPKDLKRKYENELHANELVLLAYYIAAINIQNTYHECYSRVGGNPDESVSEAFPGIVHTDTFTMTQEKKLVDDANSKRAKKQKETPITVIMGNPPYSAGQKSENDANKNTEYPQLDEKIRTTYAAVSTAVLKTSLYDSYIRAFRWSSDRIGKKGIICYVSNGSYIDGNAMDGFRKCLAEEFTEIYCFNLRGNQRTSGELSRKEGGKIFGSGSRTPVAVTLLIKNPARAGKPCTIHYRDIGDYLDQKTKLQIIADAVGLQGVQWETITPNEKHDWINQRGDTFDTFISLGDKKDDKAETFFDNYSSGLKTNRDAWCYNFSSKRLAGNMERMIKFYNEQVEEYKEKSKYFPETSVDDFVNNDPQKISWTVNLKKSLVAHKQLAYRKKDRRACVYRPFCKHWAYFNKDFNERPGIMPMVFPTEDVENFVISVCGVGTTKDFTALITNTLPDYEAISKNQCFPLYTYEKTDSKTRGLIEAEGDYVRRENISDKMLQKFRERYSGECRVASGEKKDNSSLTTSHSQLITKEDIFYYVYGILHSGSYRERFASDLKKQLPRIPMVDDFWTFSKSGRKLAELHLNYETGKMYPLKEIATGSVSFKVNQMKYPSKTDKSKIIYNGTLTLDGIPSEAYRYIVNGKSALDWIVERYAVTTHKDSGIKNDPNDWCQEIGNERYIVDLIKRIVYLSVESVKIIKGLPRVEF